MIKKSLIYIVGAIVTVFIGLLFVPIAKNIEKEVTLKEEKLHNFLEPLQIILNASKQDFNRFMYLWNKNNDKKYYWEAFNGTSDINLNLHGKYLALLEIKNDQCFIKLLDNSNDITMSLGNLTFFCTPTGKREIYISKIGQNQYTFRHTRSDEEEKAWIEFIKGQKEKYYGVIQDILTKNAQYYIKDAALKNEIELLNMHMNEYLRVISRWDKEDYSKMNSISNFPKNLELVIKNEIQEISEEKQKLQDNPLYVLIQKLHF